MLICSVRLKFKNSIIGLLIVLIFLIFNTMFYLYPNTRTINEDDLLISVRQTTSFIHHLHKTKINLYKTGQLTDESENMTNSRRIFFHETSGRGSLNFQQCCTVESAAKHNPTRPVELYLSAAYLNTSNPWIDILRNYTNVNVILVDNEKYFNGSPFEEWFEKGEWRQSRFQVAHLSDYIRLVTLYNGGGLYMDLDYVVLKPLDERVLQNVLLVEGVDASSLSNGVMHMMPRHWLVSEIMKFLVAVYDPDDYYLHGPTAVTKVFTELCHDKQDELEQGQETSAITVIEKQIFGTKKKKKKKKCPDVKIMSSKYFYPIGSPFWHMYYEDVSIQTLSMLNESFAAHMWSSLSHKEPISMGSKQLYVILAKEHCPHTSSKAAYFTLI